MLTRSFQFTPDTRGRIDFRLCYEAFRGLDPTKIEKDHRRHLAEIQGALESISVPMGELREGDDIDLRPRSLQPDGGAMTLSQWAFERLTAALESAPFHAGLSLQLESLRERLSAAEKRETEHATPKRMKAV